MTTRRTQAEIDSHFELQINLLLLKLDAGNDGLDNPIFLRNAITEFRYSQDFLIHEAISFLPTITEVFNCPLGVLSLMRAKAILGRSNLTTAEETYWRDQLIRHLSNIEFWIPVNLTAYVIFKRLLDQDIVSKKQLRRLLAASTVSSQKNGHLEIGHHWFTKLLIILAMLAFITTSGYFFYFAATVYSAEPIPTLFLSIFFMLLYFIPCGWGLWFLGPFSWRAGKVLKRVYTIISY